MWSAHESAWWAKQRSMLANDHASAEAATRIFFVVEDPTCECWSRLADGAAIIKNVPVEIWLPPGRKSRVSRQPPNHIRLPPPEISRFDLTTNTDGSDIRDGVRPAVALLPLD